MQLNIAPAPICKADCWIRLYPNYNFFTFSIGQSSNAAMSVPSGIEMRYCHHSYSNTNSGVRNRKLAFQFEAAWWHGLGLRAPVKSCNLIDSEKAARPLPPQFARQQGGRVWLVPLASIIPHLVLMHSCSVSVKLCGLVYVQAACGAGRWHWPVLARSRYERPMTCHVWANKNKLAMLHISPRWEPLPIKQF